MRNLLLESGVASCNKYGEDLCGDFISTIEKDDMTTIVLSDGLGSGVKANILSTLTGKILSTLSSHGVSMEESVDTIAQTLPVCSVRHLAYATFTLLQVTPTAMAYLAQYDNPNAILLRDGKSVPYPIQKRIIGEKEISESRFQLRVGDMLILMSDGVINAGMGKLTDGWPLEDVISFVEDFYTPDLSPQRMATRILDACNSLYMDHTDDDVTVAVYKIRARQAVNVLFGPPEHKEDDERILRLFFGKAGKRIVCGGSTAQMVSRYLRRPLIQTEMDPDRSDLPPAYRLEGVDLVTEGVLTVSKVLEMAKRRLSEGWLPSPQAQKADAAAQISHLLFESATDIHLFVGKAINPAHQDPSLQIGYTFKIGLVYELRQCLEQMGKTVNITYC